MSQTDNTKELKIAIALYSSLNKFIPGFKDSAAKEQLEELRSNIPELEANLADLQNGADILQNKLDSYSEKLKLPTENPLTDERASLEKTLDGLISQNSQLLSKVSPQSLVFIAEYQSSLKKQLEIMFQTRELMDDILPKLELSIRLNEWQKKAQVFSTQATHDLPELLILHREYYDIFAGPEEDKNLLTPQLHNQLEAVIKSLVEAKLSSPTLEPEEFSALFLKLKGNLGLRAKGSPTLETLLKPLIFQALKQNDYAIFDKMDLEVKRELLPYLSLGDYQKHWIDLADSALKNPNHKLKHLIALLQIYQVGIKNESDPQLKKLANEIQLTIALNLKNELATPNCDRTMLTTLFKSLPEENQKEIEKIIGPHAFTEMRKNITTQFSEKRPRKATPPGAPPSYERPEPKKPKQ